MKELPIVDKFEERLLDLPYFNYSCVAHEGGYLFAGRNGWSKAQSLNFVRTDRSYRVLGVYEAQVGRIVNDSRLFVRDGQIHCLFAAQESLPVFRQILGRVLVTPQSVELTETETLPMLQHSEKNWIPQGDFLIHDLTRHVLLNRRCEIVYMETPAPRKLHGGTGFIPIAGHLAGFAQSYELVDGRRSYSAYLLVLEDRFPFRKIGMALLDPEIGLRYRKIDRTRWIAEQIHSVVFPVSIHSDGEEVHLIMGVHDSLNLALVFNRDYFATKVREATANYHSDTRRIFPLSGEQVS
jgi:hypothetical protein